MHIFYEPVKTNNLIVLNPEESIHCSRVLRLENGSKVHVTDGKGNLYDCVVTSNNIKNCLLTIEKEHLNYTKRNYRLHIAIAPTKNIERFEWFLEKATETGIDEITPIICEHSERKVIKTDRLNKIIVSAMKQSMNTIIPVLNQLIGFKDFVKNNFNNSDKFIAHCESETENHIKNIIKPASSSIVLIGPEGDFSPREIEQAHVNNFKNLYLGENRFRTETAGIVVCSDIRFINF